jgi:phosphopentomutase
MAETLKLADRDFRGLCFTNLVDFDMHYGHRNDVDGYAAALSDFDRLLGDFLPQMRRDDLLLITADHGCDPATPSTDHSREYTPLLICGSGVKEGIDLGTRPTFADIAATVLDYFALSTNAVAGESLLSLIERSCV